MASTYQGRRPAGGRRPGGKGGRGKGGRGGARTVAVRRTAPVVREPVTLPSVLTVAELAEKLRDHRIEVIKELMKLGMMANINQQIDYATAARVAQALGWETNGGVPESSSRRRRSFESRRSEAETDPEAPHAAAGRHDHGARRPRQDQAARRDPLGQCGGGRGRRHHPAHRRLSGRYPGTQDHLPRHPGPRGVHRHARPWRPGDRRRGPGRGRRRRRDADDAGSGRAHQVGQGADGRGDQQDRSAGRQPGPRQAAALRDGGHAGGVGRRRPLRRGFRAARSSVSTTCWKSSCSSPTCTS